MEETDGNHSKDISHHKQQEFCTSRAVYRQGRKLTAVKVFTTASESQHLFVYGVPKINLRSELKALFNKYGKILNIHVVPDIQVEMFTECFHVQYDRIQSARIAKRLVDNRSFYGGVLHVCYAPENESLKETNVKLQQREKEVLRRLHKYNQDFQNGELMRNDDREKYQQNSISSFISKYNEADISAIYKVDGPLSKKVKINSHNNCQYKSMLPNVNGSSAYRNNSKDRDCPSFKEAIFHQNLEVIQFPLDIKRF